ncbi:MAG: PAS domain S-box protein [Spirochaetes bacterium]|nr:PAS domain S-box protein [Spirochaetota bacterium]
MKSPQKIFSKIFLKSDAGVYIARSGKFQFVNPRFEKITGYKKSELIGRTQQSLIHPDDKKIIEKKMAQIQEGKLTSLYEYRIITKKKEILWVSETANFILYRSKPAILAKMVDITDRKRMEASLQYRVHFETIITTISSNFINLEPEEIDQKINESLETISKFAGMSRTWIFLLNNEKTHVHYTYEWCDKNIKSNVDQFRTVPVDKFPWASLKLKKGQVFYVPHVDHLPREAQSLKNLMKKESVISLLCIPLLCNRSLVGFFGFDSFCEKKFNPEVITLLKVVGEIFTNALVRKRTDLALRESEQRNRALIEAIPDLMFIITKDGTFKEFKADKEHYLPIPPCDIIGKNLRQISFFKDYRDLAFDKITKALKTGLAQTFEYKISTPMGLAFYEARMAPLNKGEIVAIIRDITQRIRAEEQLKDSLEKISSTLQNTIYAMARIVEERDPYTAGHQQQVAYLASAIATHMDLSQHLIDGIHLTAMIHDIGKIYIPAEILSKPGPLSDIEFDLIKHHPKHGHDVIQTIEFPWPVADILIQHHERNDGSGYPQGLGQKQISMEAKILAVADVVEAMSSHRPYREALGIKKALQEINDNKGRLYDIRVADTCLDLFNNNKFQF